MIYQRWLATALVLVVVFLAAVPASAEVIADFAGGDSSTVVDGWPGMAGGGWAGAWIEYVNNATYTVGTTNTAPQVDPASDTGIYLDVSMTPTRNSSPGRYASVARDYTAGIDVAVSHTLEFSLRVNEDVQDEDTTFTTSTDRYQLFDCPDWDQGGAGANCSWIIGAYGGSATWLSASKVKHWVVYDGNNDAGGFYDAQNIDTGIAVTKDTVYDFLLEIDADTKTWDVTISSGGTTLYDSTEDNPDGLGWRNADATVAGLPHFATYGDTTADTRAYSLDSIKITQIPEPSTLVLILALSMIGLIRRSR